MTYLRKAIMVFSAVLTVIFTAWGQTAPAPEVKTGTLQTGQMACTRPFFTNGPSAELKGEVTSKPKVPILWKLERSKNNAAGSYTVSVDALARVIDAEVLQSQQPNKFPAYFKACVENTTSFTVNYSLSIGPEQD